MKKSALVFFLLGLCATTAWAGPDDIVPRGHIAYDFLGSLAASGRLTGYTLRDFQRGDRLYTRREIARILQTNAEQLTGDAPVGELQSKSPEESFAATRRLLFVEFAPELRRLGFSPSPNSAPVAPSGDISAFGKARFLTDPVMGAGTYRAAVTLPVARDGLFVASAGNWREEWYPVGDLLRNSPEMPSVSTAARGGPAANYTTSETAYFRLNGRVLDVSVGAMPLRWGPGYVGGLLFSDEAASVPQVRLEKEFRVPGWLGRQIGPLYFTQLYGQFFDPDVPGVPSNARGTRRHLAARRIETAGDGHWQFSIAEAYKATRLPDPIFSQILPFYLYQNDWTSNSRRRTLEFLVSDPQPNTNWMNYFGSVTLTYQPDGRGTVFYVDYALDDIKAPGGLGRSDSTTPRKLGQQYGVYLPDVGGLNRYAFRLEYTATDRETFTNISPPVAWDRDGLPLGFAGFANASILFARLDATASEKIKLAVEGQTRRRGVDLPERNEPETNRVGLYGTYALRRDAFVGGRLEWQEITPQRGNATTQTRFELSFGTGF